jgi:hypothetical protein
MSGTGPLGQKRLAGPGGQMGQDGGGGGFREETLSLQGHVFHRGAQVRWAGRPAGPSMELELGWPTGL